MRPNRTRTICSFSLLLGCFAFVVFPAFAQSPSSSLSSGSASLSALSAKQNPATANAGMPKVFAPTLPRTAYTRYPWKTDIVATVFWVGEQPTQNNPTPNHKSSWDVRWMQNFGGYDNPDPGARTDNYTPKGFTPNLNPFYVALPYNDVLNYKSHKPEAERVIPWFKQCFVKPGRSVLRGTWLAIRYGNRVCYAQWEDCGPFVTDDHEYVFGNARPKNTSNKGAGIDVAPAVRDYLGMPSGAAVDWRFVDINEIPEGPWTKMGQNNHFVRIANLKAKQSQEVASSRLEELRRLRDQYFRSEGQ